MDRDDPQQWSRLALLADPVRRAIHDLFAGTAELTREQVAGQVGVSPALASHHLGKLVDAELLTKHPGVAHGREGRPPATYQRGGSPRLPGRRPELLTDLLAGAGRPDLTRVRDAARERGRELTPATGPPRARARRAMDALGFAPRTGRRTLDSGGCPFVARELAHPDVACEVALSLAQGIADEVEPARVERVEAGPCCVRLLFLGS